MNLTVIGHITIDNLKLGDINLITLGGAASYSSLIGSIMGSEVNLLTKYGNDLPKDYLMILLRNKIKILENSVSNGYPTTKFEIVIKDSDREIYLRSRCEDISLFEDASGDAAIISPVAGEVGNNLINTIRKSHDVIFLDPQGFIREFNNNGSCFMKNIDRKILKYSDIIKMDEEESFLITGFKEPIQALKYIINSGIQIAIFTRGSKGVLLSCPKGLFKIPIIRTTKLVDTTGVGDIFSGAFTVTYLQQNDPIWSGCIAVAASSMGISKIGLSKIPDRKLIINMAEDIFERVEQIENL